MSVGDVIHHFTRRQKSAKIGKQQLPVLEGGFGSLPLPLSSHAWELIPQSSRAKWPFQHQEERGGRRGEWHAVLSVPHAPPPPPPAQGARVLFAKNN